MCTRLNYSPEAGHVCHLCGKPGISDELQFEDVKLAEGEEGRWKARQGDQLQPGAAVCIYADHGVQLLLSPAPLQVFLQQPALADRGQKHGETLDQQRVVLVQHVYKKGQVIPQVGDISQRAQLLY